MRLIHWVISLGIATGVAVGTPGCGESVAAKEDRLCVPGDNVFCRCADRTPGTKRCREDGKSFDACTTGEAGECKGGEIPNPDPGPGTTPPTPGTLDACPGKSTAVQPGVEVRLDGDTSTATIDRKGRQGACAVGAGGRDHVYRIIPSGTGSLEVKVQGIAGLDPVAYVRATCDDEASQLSCAAPTPNRLAQLKVRVITGREYFLFVDGASETRGPYSATLKLTTGSFCGDGEVTQGEACDDGNNTDDDGCSSDCARVGGNPPSGGACPGHPVHVWPGKTVTGAGSTASYGSTFGAPSTACDFDGTNAYPDHVYEVTPHGTGELVVTLSAPSSGPLPNLMLTARPTCASPAGATAKMCANDGVAGVGETMTVPVTSGTAIYVAVDGGGVSNSAGPYALSFRLK